MDYLKYIVLFVEDSHIIPILTLILINVPERMLINKFLHI